MILGIVLLLALGFLIGKVFGHRSERMSRALSSAGLFVLLFVMGMRLGGDHRIRTQLSSFGLSALLLALASGMGAMICAAFLERLVRRKSQ